ncbi:MAG: diaminopimelate epimerase [Eubacteriales bacterium]|nr:diaminopimelate epimerase [Bacillota bacterium]MBV1726454.1 diaminopimelate epimerase [Desulforudis sp.]MDP3050218.1 diaminopimelate epimerase [Eubacteriales bacterium]MDQ7788869.1 diaminopimelate epimerase [Clostridia bacterium]MBU4532624.1 diaminopimelate epimerase [Bacillota bacterium]
MQFTKMHGLGNDFIIVNALNGFSNHNPAALAKNLCNRRTGIGADGLVLVRPSTEADVRMQVFNSDGSEPEMCGNAIRCVAKYLFERNLVNKTAITVETLAGLIVPEVLLGADGIVTGVRVDMGEPRLERAEIPMVGSDGRVVLEPLELEDTEFPVTMVSMGNPHCVIFVPDLEQVDFERLGPAIEKLAVFPARTNVEFVKVSEPGRVEVKVWERGAGPTMACGTGACAVAVAGVLARFTDRRVAVSLPGGVLDIEWAENNHVYMTGPAEEVFEGTVVRILTTEF